mgnify:CR=1 FL=1
MMWPTGSKPKPLRARAGFTFVEIMVALAILSAGLVAVYKSLFVLLDSVGYVSSRLQAQYLVDNKLWEIENKINNTLAADASREDITSKKMKDFKWEIGISPIKGLQGLSNMKVAVLWQEKARQVQAARDTYLEK